MSAFWERVLNVERFDPEERPLGVGDCGRGRRESCRPTLEENSGVTPGSEETLAAAREGSMVERDEVGNGGGGRADGAGTTAGAGAVMLRVSCEST